MFLFYLCKLVYGELESSKFDVDLHKHCNTMEDLAVFFFFVTVSCAKDGELFESPVNCFMSCH